VRGWRREMTDSRTRGGSPSPGSHLPMRFDLSPQAGRGKPAGPSVSIISPPPSTKPHRALSSSFVPSRPLPEPSPGPAALLPDRFEKWFASRGWSPRAHQLALLAKAREDRSALLIAPTGAGKTLAGFLPTLVELTAPSHRSAPLLPRSGGEGSGVGGRSASPVPVSERAHVETPPEPSPPRAARTGGG